MYVELGEGTYQDLDQQRRERPNDQETDHDPQKKAQAGATTHGSEDTLSAIHALRRLLSWSIVDVVVARVIPVLHRSGSSWLNIRQMRSQSIQLDVVGSVLIVIGSL